MENSIKLPQKMQIKVPYNPAILLLSIQPEKIKKKKKPSFFFFSFIGENFIFNFFYQSMVDLQCCVNSCCTAQHSDPVTHMYTLFFSFCLPPCSNPRYWTQFPVLYSRTLLLEWISKISDLKKYMHSNVHCSTIYNSQTWKQPNCPLTDEWIKKIRCVRVYFIYIYIYIYIYCSAIINNEIMPFTTTWMNLEIIILITRLSGIAG